MERWKKAEFGFFRRNYGRYSSHRPTRTRDITLHGDLRRRCTRSRLKGESTPMFDIWLSNIGLISRTWDCYTRLIHVVAYSISSIKTQLPVGASLAGEPRNKQQHYTTQQCLSSSYQVIHIHCTS
jgi:hypothetical protein